MEVNLDNILKSLGLKDKFDQKAQEAYAKAKEDSDDSSIFGSREKFVEHYSNEIFGNSTGDTMAFDDFVKQAQDAGFIEETEVAGFQALVDRNGDEQLSREEASNLIGTAYDSATKENKELYESVKVQPWGTGEDDCLSRIVQKHVDGVKLYSDDYNQYIEETCKLNNIDNPNNFSNQEVKLPEIKRDAVTNEIMRDDNGKLQFYSEDELKEIKGIKDNKEGVQTTKLEDGTFLRETTDENGNITKTEFLDSDKEDAEAVITIDYKYDENGKKVGFEQNNKDGYKSSGTYDDQGRKATEETTTAPGNVVHTKYEYNDDGTSKRIDTKDDGYKSETQVDKDGHDIKGSIEFPDGSTWETAYKYNDDGSCEKTIEKSDGTTSVLQIDKTGLPVSEVSTDSNGTVAEAKFVEGRETERTMTHKDGSVTHATLTKNGIITYEKKDASGELIESGKKDAYGEISSVKSERGGTISTRKYEDGSTIEWQKGGSEMGSVYKDGKSLTGSDFINWLNVDDSIKEQLTKWVQQQDSTPANSEIYNKSLELKLEAEN